MVTNRPLKFLLFFFLTLFQFANISIAQSYLLSSLPVEGELSSRQITCFFQDSKGFMWIGTEDGLNLYNANSIKIFKHDVKNKNSLLDNYIQDLCEDKKGNIWIATADGVDRYSPVTNTFQHFTEDEEKTYFGFKPKVFIDRKGIIWIGCEGLFRFDSAQMQFKKINNPYSNKQLSPKLANTINGFFNDSKNNYWISTYDGLFLYNDTKKTFTRFDIPPGDDKYKRFGILFSSVYENKDGELWVGTWGYGIYKISIAENKLLKVDSPGVILTYSSQNLNNQPVLWYANDGIKSIDEHNKIRSRLLHVNDDPYSLRNDPVQALFTDKQNQLWIGYEKQGIQILSPGNQLIKAHTISSDNDKDNIGSVGPILKSGNSVFVGGWYNNALCELDNDFKVVKWWKYLPANQTKDASNVGDLYAGSNNEIWVACVNGLISINKNSGEIKNYKFDTSVNKRSFFLKILPESDSVLWLAGFNNGLSRFSLKTHQLQSYIPPGKSIFWKIVFDKNGNIWCANNEGFLEKFDRQKKSFTDYGFDTLTEKAIYFDLAYDSSSNLLWVATTNGLLKTDLNTMHAKLLAEKDGLPASITSLLAWDSQHRLWVGTSHGLSLYDPKKNSFQNFYINNGLSTEKLDHSLSFGPDGILYIGADNSIMTMDISGLDERKEISPVYITSVTENGNLLQPESKNGHSVINLPYYRNNLSFDFAITDFINSEDNQLLYKLEGWDKDFIKTKRGNVNYNKLPPGHYVFHVKGINHNGIKNETGDSIRIVIHPSFWQTNWFIGLLSFVLLTLFVLIVRYVSQRNLKEKLLRLEKEQAVEKERNRISRDMHDDLGSGLTKIAIMSEVVKKQIHEPEKAKQQLENISESSRELVDNLQDIIWVLNPKNDTLESLAAYIREYALKFFEPFKVELQFNFPEKFPEIKLSEETRRNIFLTVKESFNNIGKHAWCNKVEMSINDNSSNIILRIKDDGKGFDITKVRQFSNGLTNMQQRIEQVGGKYEIVSASGKGTATTIEIPI